MVFSITLLLILSPLLIAGECVQGLRKVDLQNKLHTTQNSYLSPIEPSLKLPPGQPLPWIPGSFSPPLALRPCFNTNHTHHTGIKRCHLVISPSKSSTRSPCSSVAGLSWWEAQCCPWCTPSPSSSPSSTSSSVPSPSTAQSVRPPQLSGWFFG